MSAHICINIRGSDPLSPPPRVTSKEIKNSCATYRRWFDQNSCVLVTETLGRSFYFYLFMRNYFIPLSMNIHGHGDPKQREGQLLGGYTVELTSPKGMT